LNSFSLIITKLRKQKGYSQKVAAEKLKISQALLSHYEKGIRECGLSFVSKIADLYGVSCDFLLGRETGEQISDGSSAIPLIKENDQIIKSRLHMINCVNAIYAIISSAENEKIASEIGVMFQYELYYIIRALNLITEADGKNRPNLYRMESRRNSSYSKLYEMTAEEDFNGAIEELINDYPTAMKSFVKLIDQIEEKK